MRWYLVIFFRFESCVILSAKYFQALTSADFFQVWVYLCSHPRYHEFGVAFQFCCKGHDFFSFSLNTIVSLIQVVKQEHFAIHEFLRLDLCPLVCFITMLLVRSTDAYPCILRLWHDGILYSDHTEAIEQATKQEK